MWHILMAISLWKIIPWVRKQFSINVFQAQTSCFFPHLNSFILWPTSLWKPTYKISSVPVTYLIYFFSFSFFNVDHSLNQSILPFFFVKSMSSSGQAGRITGLLLQPKCQRGYPSPAKRSAFWEGISASSKHLHKNAETALCELC